MRKNRTKEQTSSSLKICEQVILSSIKPCGSKTSDFEFPDFCRKQDVQKTLVSLRNSGKIYKTGNKRSSKYFINKNEEIPEELEFQRNTPGKVQEKTTEGIKNPKSKISEFLDSLNSGKIGKIQAETPLSMAKRFSEHYGFGVEESWEEIRKACKDGFLDTEFRFSDGWRLFCWKT